MRGSTRALWAPLVVALLTAGSYAERVTKYPEVGGGRGDLAPVGQFPDATTPALAVLGGAIVAYYSFVGFETSANVAEEILNPSKVYPRAPFGVLITAGVVYAAVGIASAIALAPDQLAGSSGPLPDVAAASGVAEHRFLPSILSRVLPQRRTP